MENKYYFAYGSNMNVEQMKKRCPSSSVIGSAVLRDHKIAFTRFSKKRNSGVADVLVSPDSEVWGILYSVTNEDLVKLDKFEGAPAAYKRSEINVSKRSISENYFNDMQANPNDVLGIAKKLHDEGSNYYKYEKVNAIVYEVVNKDLSCFPALDYLNILVDAAYEYSFPESYIKELEAHGKTDIHKKSNEGTDFLLQLLDFANRDEWPPEVESVEEWGGARLVVTGNPERKAQLARDYPLDLVILTPHWKKLSWLVSKIYFHPSINWQIDSSNKYEILNVLGKAMEEYQIENPEDKEASGICTALIARAYEMLTE